MLLHLDLDTVVIHQGRLQPLLLNDGSHFLSATILPLNDTDTTFEHICLCFCYFIPTNEGGGKYYISVILSL